MKKSSMIMLLLIFCLIQIYGQKPIATFSICGFDPKTGDLGVAVQSKFLAVGSVVPWAKTGIGAIATQSYANYNFGPNGLNLLQKDYSAKQTIQQLLKNDPERSSRQIGVIDSKGNSQAYTGIDCLSWAGHVTGNNYCVQGNILKNKTVVSSMAAAFENNQNKGLSLAQCLLSALKAGQKAGGDRRGRQSAAILIVRKNAGYGKNNDRYIDLRVDDHKTPIKELERLLQLKKSNQ